MVGPAALAVVIIGGVAVLQSTLLGAVAIAGVVPDLALVIIVFVAHKNGPMMGQIVGFLGGVVLDLMSLSPLGLHALIGTVIGYLYGLTRGKMFVDPIFMPIIMVVVATIIKVLTMAVAGALFRIEYAAGLLSSKFFVELGYSSLVAPMIFALLGTLLVLQADRRRGGE